MVPILSGVLDDKLSRTGAQARLICYSIEVERGIDPQQLDNLSSQLGIMFCSYSESVLAHADAEGRLNAFDVKQLLSQHGFTTAEWVRDCEARGWGEDAIDDAQRLLTWLGY